jgi:Rrf2 family protein
VKLDKSTRYALHFGLELALAGERPVTVADVAARHRLPPGALAKAVQRLVHAGIASGTRGIGGGYRLARSPAAVTVLDIVDALEPRRPGGDCLVAARPGQACAISPTCRLRVLFDEVDEMARSTFASVTLETLARPVLANGAGKPPGSEGRPRGAARRAASP